MSATLLLLAACITIPTMIASTIITPGAKLQRLATGYSFTEGPAADADGDVYFTDQPNDRIMKWVPDENGLGGNVQEWLKPAGRSNGMRFDHHGNIISCADELNQLWSIAPDKKATVLVKDFEGKLLNGPNDVWIRPDGGMYFTDPLYERPYWKRDPKVQQSGEQVYFVSADHKTVNQVTQDLTKPNGIIGTPDGKDVYVADIGANVTYRYKVQLDGTLTEKKLFCSLGSDGMTIDDEGNVYLTGHGVTVFNKFGAQIEHIDVPEGWSANIAFAGRDFHTLFITASESIYGIRMRVRGASHLK